MRNSKRVLAGVAAGALAAGLIPFTVIAAAGPANAAISGLTASSFVTAATPYQAPSGNGTLTNLMNLITITGDDTFATSGDDSILSIRLDSAPADDTGTGFAAIQLSADDTTSGTKRAGSGVALTSAGAATTAPTVLAPADYVWTRGSVVQITNNSATTRSIILRGTAPNAGTYGYTAWVNKVGGNPAVLDPGEPFVSGSITVGGTVAAFAVAPASQSVGSGQVATYRVTATDSAGRATFPNGTAASSTRSWANLLATPTTVTLGGDGSATAVGTLSAAKFINLNSATTAQGTATFTASSTTAGSYTLSVTPGGSLPGTVTSAAAAFVVNPVATLGSARVTGPATATTSNVTYTPTATVTAGASAASLVYVPTTADTVTFRMTAAAGTTPGQLLPYSVDDSSAAPAGVTSLSGTVAVDANLQALVTVKASAIAAGDGYTVTLGSTGALVTYSIVYAVPALSITNLTTVPGLGTTSFVKTATATTVRAEVTDQFNQPLQGILVSASPSISAAASATTDAKGVATIAISAPAATVTSQTVTFRLTPPLGSQTGASSALTLLYNSSGSPSSLTMSSAAGNVTATALATQYVDVSGDDTGLWTSAAANGERWMQVNATVGGAVLNVPVIFSAPDAYFTDDTTNLLGGTNPEKGEWIYATTGGGGTATVYVKATKTGTVTVTATAGDLTQTITWKVANTAADARVIEVTPAKQDAAGLAQVTAKVTDAFGNTVGNAALNFSELGVGNFLAGTSTLSTATGPTGTVTVDVLSTEVGDSKVTVIAGAVANYAGVKDSPVVGAPAGVSSGVADIKFISGGTKSITIVGERATVSGKPGVRVEGATTGLLPGKTVIPYVRFPGGEYTQGSARPAISATGDFEWSRKTGKKAYVYFTNDDGAVTSNRIIIAAS